MNADHGSVARLWQRTALAALALLGVAATAYAADYPGRATDLKPGDKPVISIQSTGSTGTEPRVLRVRVGTDVTWLNATDGDVSIRFDQPIPKACGTPVNFTRSYDGKSYATDIMPPFAEARLCFSQPGRYDYVVSKTGTESYGSKSGAAGEDQGYGTVIVE